MTWRRRQIGTLILFLTLPVWFPSFTSAQLNSLVARVDQPRGPIPAECEQGLSAAPPLRVAVRDIEPPRDQEAEALAPPSGALRTALQETQIALTRNDRPAFNAALSRTKALLLNYPAGAERRTAEEIVRLHEIAARLWDTQYEAPFFSDTDPQYSMVRDLPGYADAIRRNTLTDDNDRRFYPTAESREFVAQLAAERLQRLGIRNRTAEQSPRPAAREVGRVRGTSRTPSTPRASSTTTTRKRVATKAAPRSPKRAAAPPAVAAAPAPTPAPAPAPASTQTSPPVDTAASTIPEDPVRTTTAATTTPPAAETAAVPSTGPVTSTNVVPESPSTSRGRSVILPAILILIGLGVLIVLFRASK